MLKLIFSEIKEYKKDSILAPVLMTIEVLLNLSLPLFMKEIVDRGINGNDINIIIKNGVIMLLITIIALFCGMAVAHFANRAGAGFAKNLRLALFKKIQSFSFGNIDKFDTSSLITRIMTDVTNIQNSFQMLLRMGVRAPLTLIVATTITFSINSEISYIFIYAILFLVVSLGFLIYFAFKAFRKVFEKYDDLNASIEENITNIRVVKSFVKENDEITKFEKASDNIYKMFVKAENIAVLNSPIMNISIYGVIVALSWIGAHMIVETRMTTGDLMSLFQYTMNIMISLAMISAIFIMVVISAASFKRVGEVLLEEPIIKNSDNPITVMSEGNIEFKNVYFKYYLNSENYILDNINLKINKGETIGIIGGTGSSKTTLVSLIPRLYDVTSGEVLIDGVNTKDYDIKFLRDNVSMVLQKNVLFSGTIKDNLKWGNPNASDEEIIKACKIAQAHDFIINFKDGYDTELDQGGTNVSGGQKQRICIARALLKNPKILILDDSTSAVDTNTDQLIRKGFKEDLKNMSKIIISQRISSIMDADRIIVLDGGRINGIGTHEYLLENNEIYKEVYETQYNKGGDFDEHA